MELFEFINKNDNDQISKMKGNDLQKLFELLNRYYLELRKDLNIDNYITFGLELEFEYANIRSIVKNLDMQFPDNKWIIKNDNSLIDGAEINSPILTDNPKIWDDLNKICDILYEYSSIGKNAGGHIHVGAQILDSNSESLLNFLKLWSVYENIIFRFLYGVFLGPRPSLITYATPMKEEFMDVCKKYNKQKYINEDILNELKEKRYQCVNFQNLQKLGVMGKANTIEFRSPNGTLNPTIWQNNVNFIVKLLLYVKSKKFNEDIIENRNNQNNNKYDELYYYSQIFLQQSLELADMLFDNNLDKIYFLRQYLKSFQVSNNNLEYAKKFTKNM